MNFSNKLKLCTSKSASLPSAKPLYAIDEYTQDIIIDMIKSLQLLAIIFILISLGCSNSNEQMKAIDLPDFNSEKVIHLHKQSSLEHVSMLSLSIEGKFNGYTQLWLGTSDSVFTRKYDYKNGFVDLKFEMGDWYNEDCFVKLVPIESSKGKIELKYTFH